MPKKYLGGHYNDIGIRSLTIDTSLIVSPILNEEALLDTLISIRIEDCMKCRKDKFETSTSQSCPFNRIQTCFSNQLFILSLDSQRGMIVKIDSTRFGFPETTHYFYRSNSHLQSSLQCFPRLKEQHKSSNLSHCQILTMKCEVHISRVVLRELEHLITQPKRNHYCWFHNTA